jgi:hypothetical protein
LLGAGISDQSESTYEVFCKENPNAIIVQHYGGSGLLMRNL